VQGSGRDPLGLAHPGRVFLAVAVIIVLVDQLTKAVVRAYMHMGQSLSLIPNVIRLTLVRNSGAAFGLFPGRQPVFVLTSLLVLFVIAAYWRRAHPSQWPVVIALSMVAGGALGNLIDRAIVGHVTDFFEFTFVEFPVFNVADMGIVGGVAVLMVWILLGPEPSREPEVEHASAESADGESADGESADGESADGENAASERGGAADAVPAEDAADVPLGGA